MVTVDWALVYEKLSPIIKAIVKKIKKEYVFIPSWHRHRNYYVYHIESDLRKGMYTYLSDLHMLRRFGLVFGVDELISTKERLLDVGVYGFLPFYEIAATHGKEKVGGKQIIDLCGIFAKNIRGKTKAEFEKAVKAANLIINFVLDNCATQDFPKMLVKGSDKFADVYSSLATEVTAPMYRHHVLSRFLKASFHGMYISSTKFAGLGLSTNPREFLDHTEEIAARIGKEPVQMVKSFKRLKFIDRLIAIFEPQTRRDVVASALGRMPAISTILTDEYRMKRLKLLFNAFKDDMDKFDEETRLTRRTSGILYRPPIIVNVYRDENSNHIRSVCAGYNDEKAEIQQIKFGGHKFLEGHTRFKKLIDKYFVKDYRHLPSEENGHTPMEPHSN